VTTTTPAVAPTQEAIDLLAQLANREAADYAIQVTERYERIECIYDAAEGVWQPQAHTAAATNA
jgi:hypothetical protein